MATFLYTDRAGTTMSSNPAMNTTASSVKKASRRLDRRRPAGAAKAGVARQEQRAQDGQSQQKFICSANLTRDPEARQLPSGQTVVTIPGHNRSFANARGKPRGSLFCWVEVWGRQKSPATTSPRARRSSSKDACMIRGRPRNQKTQPARRHLRTSSAHGRAWTERQLRRR